MKIILTYIALFAIPAINFAQNVEQIFMEDYLEKDLRIYCEIALKNSVEAMGFAESADYFFFHKGKCYAYSEILRILDEDQ